ncbi:MAG: NACHT domain-containing protein [Actinobacteria bacterium]|nr:NACHT domain-containing protein [Actinomycetota bacterium]
MASEPFSASLAKIAVEPMLRAALDRLRRSDPARARRIIARVDDALARHLRFVDSWSARFQIKDMSHPADVDEATIPLGFTDVPRRFRPSQSTGAFLTEEDLLEQGTNYLLLGDPGAGKTTTVRRLARKVLTKAAASSGDIWLYPIVLVCRDHDWASGDFLAVLKKLLGLDPTEEPADASEWATEDILTDFLDAGPALLLVDGLDEIPQPTHQRLETTIQRFADSLRVAKVIVTRRSGDYQNIEGFVLAEISSLSRGEIDQIIDRQIIDRATIDRERFWEALRDNPAADLATRPLFLLHLLLVFQRGGGQIPDRPTALYRRMTRLMLQDWDEERKISRASRYARFDVDAKLDFLSALSFRLMIGKDEIRFSHESLVSAYRSIAPHFGLPLSEAVEVAREIETHTGIIVQSGDSFEFSHLSLQEYLSGLHIVMQPQGSELGSYLTRYPAPVALAVALSSDPSKWLSQLVLSPYTLTDPIAAGAFVARLGLERPRFKLSEELGHVLMKLMTTSDSVGAFNRLAQLPLIRESVALVLPEYHVTKGTMRVHFVGQFPVGRPYDPATEGTIANGVFELVCHGTFAE